ncbi:MAG: ABC transporter permease [Saprospiraceae bacterium]
MFRHHIKIGYRNLLKNKTYSAIKIGGFSIGIAAFLLITLFVKDELSYDRSYENQDRIYRMLNVSTNPDFQVKQWPSFSAPIAELLNTDYPEIEIAGRLIVRDWFLAGENQFRRSSKKQNNFEEGFAYADPALLDIFETEMIYGNREEALAKPFTMVISKKIADKYFPNQNPIGETIILNDNVEEPYTIGGVMQNLPSNTHLVFDFLLTFVGVEFWEGEQTDWCCQNYEPYLRVNPGTNIQELEEKLLAIKEDYLLKELVDTENAFAEVVKNHRSFRLQPIEDIHLQNELIADNFKHGDLRVVQLFGAIAIFILLLACINFINLFTAKSANRAKEVGVRKVAGSFKGELVSQFLTESTLYSFISIVLGTILAYLSLPSFNELAGKAIHIPMDTFWFIPSLVLLAIMIGLLAGIYPSFYLSKFQPIDVLKGNLSKGSKNSKLRSSMVVFQFTTSIILVVSALVVYHQMQFILNSKVGFDKDNLVLLHGARTLGDKTAAFKTELGKLPMVESVTNSSSFPVDGTVRNNNQFWLNGQQKIDKGVSAQAWRVAGNYHSSMKMNLLEGRFFEEGTTRDSFAAIINQTMAEKLGVDNIIGKQIWNGGAWDIVGVVEDFHFENMKREIRPLVFFKTRGNSAIIAARIQTEDFSKTMTSIAGVWDKFMPNQPIRYTLLDESYAEMYEETKRTGNVFAACAFLAILIACLGLFGLSTFMAEQRTKEIGVRKILGASSPNLYRLLTFDYLRLVLISMIIGAPVAWYLMKKWLQYFEYRIDIVWWFFAVAGILVAGIALLTVSRQALKLMFSNPVDSLRNE